MKDKQHYLLVVFAALVVVLGIYFIALLELESVMKFFYNDFNNENKTYETRGLFGDSTGAINTLFSSLAFAGVILTLYWQIQESSKNKEEDHRKQFEDVFFRMTDHFEQIILGLRISINKGSIYNLWGTRDADSDLQIANVNNGQANTSGMGDVNQTIPEKEVRTGREVFQYLYEQYMKEGYTMMTAIKNDKIDGYENIMEGQLDHYFRFYYRILRYIDDSKLVSDIQKYGYATILRAQMSSYEMLIMHYNGISSVGFEKLKPLMEKYSMLNNIREERLVQGEIEKERIFFGTENYYSDTAFKRPCYKVIEKVKDLKFLTIWSCLLTLVGTVLLLPLWNRFVVDTIFKRIPGDSFPLLFFIIGVATCYVNCYMRQDLRLVSDIRSTNNPIGERKLELENKIIKRFRQMPILLSLLLSSLIASLFSSYYMTGTFSFYYICVAYLPIVYHVFAFIVIIVEIQDGNILRNLGLLANTTSVKQC